MRSDETISVGRKLRAAKLDFPEPETPTSTTSERLGSSTVQTSGSCTLMTPHSLRRRAIAGNVRSSSPRSGRRGYTQPPLAARARSGPLTLEIYVRSRPGGAITTAGRARSLPPVRVDCARAPPARAGDAWGVHDVGALLPEGSRLVLLAADAVAQGRRRIGRAPSVGPGDRARSAGDRRSRAAAPVSTHA